MRLGSLHISAINLQETEQKILDVAINIICDENGKEYLVVGDTPTSEILVLNANSADGPNILKNTNDHQVKIVFSSTTQSGKNLISIHYPVCSDIVNLATN